MSKNAHTPGPWQVGGTRHSGNLELGRDTRLHMVGPDGDYVAAVFFDMVTGRGLKDARLISAAPDLLAALEMVRDADEDNKRDGNDGIPGIARAKIDAAISKAKGEA